MNIKNRNIGGRPTKNIAEKLKYKVTVKLATADFYTLKAKSKIAGINRSEYIRTSIRNSKIKSRLTIEQTGYLRQLCGMANNTSTSSVTVSIKLHARRTVTALRQQGRNVTVWQKILTT
jgi:hypothetical protein